MHPYVQNTIHEYLQKETENGSKFLNKVNQYLIVEICIYKFNFNITKQFCTVKLVNNF